MATARRKTGHWVGGTIRGGLIRPAMPPKACIGRRSTGSAETERVELHARIWSKGVGLRRERRRHRARKQLRLPANVRGDGQGGVATGQDANCKPRRDARKRNEGSETNG